MKNIKPEERNGNWSMFSDKSIVPEKPKYINYTLDIANSRGKKAVIRDLKKAYNIINMLLIEVNPNDAKNVLKDIDAKLWKLITEKTNN